MKYLVKQAGNTEALNTLSFNLLGQSSVVGCLSSTREALDLIPNTVKNKEINVSK